MSQKVTFQNGELVIAAEILKEGGMWVVKVYETGEVIPCEDASEADTVLNRVAEKYRYADLETALERYGELCGEFMAETGEKPYMTRDDIEYFM